MSKKDTKSNKILKVIYYDENVEILKSFLAKVYKKQSRYLTIAPNISGEEESGLTNMNNLLK